MAEWLKAAVLKTVERKFRGFKSYSLRHIYCFKVVRSRFLISRRLQTLPSDSEPGFQERWPSRSKALAC